VGGDVPVDSETVRVTDFVNLKINPAQFFRCAHMNMVCMRVCIYRSECSYMYEYLCLYCVSKKDSRLNENTQTDSIFVYFLVSREINFAPSKRGNTTQALGPLGHLNLYLDKVVRNHHTTSNNALNY
jgi:hypothetical protein